MLYIQAEVWTKTVSLGCFVCCLSCHVVFCLFLALCFCVRSPHHVLFVYFFFYHVPLTAPHTCYPLSYTPAPCPLVPLHRFKAATFSVVCQWVSDCSLFCSSLLSLSVLFACPWIWSLSVVWVDPPASASFIWFWTLPLFGFFSFACCLKLLLLLLFFGCYICLVSCVWVLSHAKPDRKLKGTKAEREGEDEIQAVDCFCLLQKGLSVQALCLTKWPSGHRWTNSLCVCLCFVDGKKKQTSFSMKNARSFQCVNQVSV